MMTVKKLYLWPLSFVVASYIFFKYYKAAKLEQKRTGNPLKLVIDHISDVWFKQNKHTLAIWKLIYDMFWVTCSIFIGVGLIFSAVTELQLFAGTLFLVPIIVLFKQYS